MKYQGNIEDILIETNFSGPFLDKIKYTSMQQFIESIHFIELIDAFENDKNKLDKKIKENE
jgi:hypothetical protein